MPGEPIWRTYDQAELDAQYDQATLVPNAMEYMQRWRERSDFLRAARPAQTLRYGSGTDETMDLFGDGTTAHLHLHGGAWRALSKDDVSFVVTGLAQPNATVAVCDFGHAPETRLPQIVGQVRAAARVLLDRYGQILVSGHSSGAHLASTLLDHHWWADAGLDAERFAGVLLVSGPYDLEPVRLSARNGYLNLTQTEAAELSVVYRLPERLPPVHVMWGDGELDEFRRQGQDLFEQMQMPTNRITRATLPANHFDMYDLFGDPASPVCAALEAFGTDR